MSDTQIPPDIEAVGALFPLARRLAEYPGFAETAAALRRRETVGLDAVHGSACALLAAGVLQYLGGPVVLVCRRQDELDPLLDELRLFTSRETLLFPAWESLPGERLIFDEIYGRRMRTLKRIASGRFDGLVVTCIQSLLQAVPDRQSVAASTRRLGVGEPIDQQELLGWLAERRFHPTSAVELPGEFASRGGIVDVFPPDGDVPIRIEWFGDQVESIRRFEVATQRSLEGLESVEITLPIADREVKSHFSSYFGDGAVWLLSEPRQLEQEGTLYLERQENLEPFFSVPATMQQLDRFGLLLCEQMAAAVDLNGFPTQIDSIERFSGDIGRVRDELEHTAEGFDVVLIVQTEGEIGRLRELLGESRPAREHRLRFVQGHLRGGFRLVREKMVLIGGGELFCRAELPRPVAVRRLGKAIDHFLDLREGDLVVHLVHGIGRYRGMSLLEKDGRVEEYLQIEFDGRTKIYVPASRIGLIQKYIGGAKRRPSLAKIGGKTWVRQKEAAQRAVVDMAADMLEMQAVRRARPGIRFPGDTLWQFEFDASFPYAETPDQLEAIETIKNDMQQPRPMDRLLCGDVGFGKTELAIRAAFKAVDNGYQVGVLVPTTILAEQHYHTFRERMSEFPFEIARLSRFCTSAQQQEIIGGLKTGRVDIVIGTHRLASRDVGFENLGLLIIDEEQRFGVEVKERLKQLRTTVDILTMTATPIPRTLHMSLLGLRDISNLATPPEERVAVETRIARFSDELVQHAILRELGRGGQTYYVHNRVQDIEAVAARLRRIVPEARIEIGHGQMPEHQLEQVMLDFIERRFDVLLATTIVESGLDIPNANTIFIDDANRYGLADLHQLRGRVGRYKHRAYCYLLVDPTRSITPNASKRLQAIKEYSEMGAGFAIAMRDLEIRGAGNILGTEQSGHIAAIGYELYCQMLENAVRAMKKLPPKLTIDVDIQLPGTAYLPDDYVPDIRQKIDLYRRLARIESPEHIEQLEEELRDRFGPPPDPVARMLRLTALKIEAALWQIGVIRLEDGYLMFEYANRPRAEQLARGSGGRLRIVDERCLCHTLSRGCTAPDAIIDTAKSVLRYF